MIVKFIFITVISYEQKLETLKSTQKRAKDDQAAVLKKTEIELKSIQNAKVQLEKNKANLKDDLATAKSALISLSSNSSSCRELLNTVNLDLNRSKAETTQLKSDCAAKEKIIVNLLSERDQATLSIKKISDLLKNYQKQLSQFQPEKMKLMNQIEQLRDEINQVKTTNRDLVAEKDKLNEDLHMKLMSIQEANNDFEMDQTILEWQSNESM